MATCGYLCPSCEGRKFMDTGEKCDWCSPEPAKPEISDEDWLKAVHDKSCCSDIGEEPDTE